ncbi:endolytic transglycosylase MltG [Patescibacteria group bacterium]|nr:endolytic transglycosylase MltG [Patescibacteria group bacterium]
MFKKILRSLIFTAVGFGMLIISIFIVVFWQGYRFWIQSPNKTAEAVAFIVEEGDGFKTVARNLQENNLVASKIWFEFYARLNGNARSIQAGEFSILPGTSYAGLIDELIHADMEEVQITIPEGFTLEQIGQIVRENFNVSKSEWDTAVGISSPVALDKFVVDCVKPANVDLEGYLFPDTYRFFVESSAEDIVEDMIGEMQKNVEDINGTLWTGWTMHDVLTLASIIEREVQSPEDMANVADIFLKRLDSGMPLQADSTVNYITGGDSPGVSIADTKIDSLYNTYMYAGLPPGPISNPGRDAIEAVLMPASNSYYYFLTTPNGEVIYSQTYQEHLDNKYKYLD